MVMVGGIVSSVFFLFDIVVIFLNYFNVLHEK